ncbi:MAG: OmpA family protein [Pseudomonadota bacterium]
MLRWIIGLVALLLVGLVHGMMTGQSRIDDMTARISSALSEAGYDWADVSMSGNVATITGTAPSLAEQQASVRVAQDARCSACDPDQKWHDVIDATEVREPVALPVQTPYTFIARKSADGNVTLSGYAPTEAMRGEILRDAVDVFGNDNVAIDRVDLADGAPDGRWGEVLGLYFRKLARLDSGRLQMEGAEGALQGTTTDPAVQDALYAAMRAEMPAGYNFVGNVSVPGSAVEVFGQSGSQTICQALLDDLKRGRKIGFRSGEAVIRGDDNFDLLGDLASAANQCPGFRIAINGYTSSDGDPELNQTLSEDRANAVLFYLSEQGGIERSRLSARGFGVQNPVASNETPEGREQNRRIEFIVSTTD